jgi:hypothetical protein
VSLSVSMKIQLIVFLIVVSGVWLRAQERLALDANSARQRIEIPIVGSSGSAAPVRGVVDGSPPPPQPLVLKVQNLVITPPNVSNSTSDRTQVQYELRLTNTGATTSEVPISPDLDKMFHVCGSRREQQVSLSLKFRSPADEERFLPGTSVWAGCPEAKDSIAKLAPGEWITYRGSAFFPSGFAPPGFLTAGWSVSEVSYSNVSGGLNQNAETRVVIDSAVQKVE